MWVVWCEWCTYQCSTYSTTYPLWPARARHAINRWIYWQFYEMFRFTLNTLNLHRNKNEKEKKRRKPRHRRDDFSSSTFSFCVGSVLILPLVFRHDFSVGVSVGCWAINTLSSMRIANMHRRTHTHHTLIVIYELAFKVPMLRLCRRVVKQNGLSSLLHRFFVVCMQNPDFVMCKLWYFPMFTFCCCCCCWLLLHNEWPFEHFLLFAENVLTNVMCVCVCVRVPSR